MIEVEMHVGASIALFGLRAKTIERLRRDLSVANDRYLTAKRMNFDLSGLPERIETLVEHPDGSVHLPRGAIKEIRAAALEDGQTLKLVSDDRVWGVPIPAVASPSLYDFQEEAVSKLEKHLQGLVVLPPGVGKTRIGVASIARLARSAFVIVPTIDILAQWRKQLEAIGLSSGELSGETKRVEDITVSTYASAWAWVKEPAFAQRFGLVIVDECHHIPCKTLQQLLTELPARWRLGLTATPDREDGQGPIVDWSFGQRLIERSTREMIHLKYLSPASIEEIETEFTFKWNGPDRKYIKALEQALTEDLTRNALIADRVAAEGKAGETVIVLTARKEHTSELTEMIKQRGVEAIALTSQIARKKRASVLEAMREGKLRVVCATSLADEGLDVQRLSRIVLAFPHQAKGATMQRLGRLLRKLEGKSARLIDIVDSQVHTLARRARGRRRAYRDAGLI